MAKETASQQLPATSMAAASKRDDGKQPVAGPPPLPGVAGPPPVPAAKSAPPPLLPTAAKQARAALTGSTGDSDSDAPGDPGRRAARRRPAGPSRGAVPANAANDDLPSIGGLIFALHQKPSKRPMQIAAIASAAWLLVSGLLGYAMLAAELQRAPGVLEMLSRPTAITLAATILIPIALFWLLALLAWRAQELKLMSSAMTEVAIRLAEPDRMAEQQIASVGQAVRRQVNHMNEAIGRALGRATELESMMQSEVANLERSYSQNEVRIRALLQELSGERNALLGTSDRVNLSLKEMGNEIPVLMERLNEQQVRLARFIEEAGRNVIALESTINASTTHLANSVGVRTQELQAVLTDQTGQLQAVLTDRTSELQSALVDRTDRLQTLLVDRTEKLQNVLGERTDTMQAVFDTFSDGLDGALANRTEGLQTVLEEYTRALDSTLQGRQQSLDAQLVERTKALDDAFSERLKLFDDSILRSTIAIDSMVADKARALSTALESHAREVGQVLGQQASQLDEQLMHGVNAVRLSSQNVTKQSLKAIEGLAGQADLLRNVSENLVTQIASVTGRFDQQGQTIMRAATALETANHRIDKTLQARQTELTETLEQLSGKTDQIDRTMRSYSASLEGTFQAAEARARTVGEELTRSAEERARLASTEFQRLQSHGTADTERTLADFRSKFSNATREVSDELGSLSNRFSDSTDELRRRAQSTIAEIDAEQARLQIQLAQLPEATRNSAETMRASLQEQLKALEHLSTLSAREAVRGDLAAPVPQQASAAIVPRSISSVTQSLAREMESRAVPPAAQAAQPAQVLPSQMQPPQPRPQPSPLPSQPAPQPQPQQQVAIAPPEHQRSENWRLGDLLARASRDAPEARLLPDEAAARSPLNIANMARTLDATTASAIWSRFRAGQRGVMVRSIYTTDGRATFDEVQHRYKAEPGFRQTVDSYMLEFEQLLRDADQRDQSGRTAQSYIVSDSGRVYLFLAHASGRLA